VTPLRRSFLNFLQDVTAHPSSEVTPAPIQNQMIDEQGKRLEAVYSRVPNIVFLTLYGVAIVAFVFVGHANGLEARRLRFPVYLMGAIVAAVILLIQDLDRPVAGFISVSHSR
jgi:hypothetical protein